MKFSLGILLFTISFLVSAGQRAVTDDGDIVILNDDNSWSYETSRDIVKIPVNTEKFIRPQSSTFDVNSKVTGTKIWINPKEWGFKKSVLNGEAEFQFQLKGQDLYGLLISERIEIEVEAFSNIALDMARTVAPDIKVDLKEYRNVNGLKVIYMEMSGTTQGVKVTYAGYYYSNDKGSTQLVTYTGTALFETYKDKITQLLNGFVG